MENEIIIYESTGEKSFWGMIVIIASFLVLIGSLINSGFSIASIIIFGALFVFGKKLISDDACETIYYENIKREGERSYDADNASSFIEYGCSFSRLNLDTC